MKWIKRPLKVKPVEEGAVPSVITQNLILGKKWSN